jgi:hypothetical protein
LIHCLAKECIAISERWQVRYDERRRRDEERRAQLEREKEVELQRLREEEEEKKIRGYDRMDKIYAMWKQTFDEKETDERGGDRGESRRERPQIPLTRVSSVTGSCLAPNTWVGMEMDSGEQNKTSNETFSLDDFILKHDLNETEMQTKISAAAADRWIQFRSNHSHASRDLTSHGSPRVSEHLRQGNPDALPQTNTPGRSKRSKGQGKKSSPSSALLDATQQLPIATRDPQESSRNPRLRRRSHPKEHDPFPLEHLPEQSSTRTEDHPLQTKKCDCLVSTFCCCQPLPFAPGVGPVPSLPTLFPQQQSQEIQEVESKINEIYSEYDEELQAFWNKITQQKQQQQQQSSSAGGLSTGKGTGRSSSTSRPSSSSTSSRRRPKSANLSSRADKNRTTPTGSTRKAPKVELYGYGCEDFSVEDEELIELRERPRSATTRAERTHPSVLVTPPAPFEPRRKYPEPPEYHTRASSSSSARPQNRKGRQIDPSDPYNFQEY